MIRAAIASDIGDMILLLGKLFSIEEDFQYDETLQRRGIELLMNSENSCLFVAEINRSIVGMVSGQLVISTAEGGPSLLVEDLVIHEEWRGRGIGKELLQEVADWGNRREANRLQLLADRNNRSALAFYEKAGWQTTNMICLRKYNRRVKYDSYPD